MALSSPILPVRVQLKNIVVLADLHGDSEKQLRFAAALAQWYGAKLTLAHACVPESNAYIPPEPLPVWLSPAEHQTREKSKEIAGNAGIARKMVDSVVSAPSVSELLDTLDLSQPDLLVLATHGRTGLDKWLKGSVTAEVFRQAQCPVLVLPPGFPGAPIQGLQVQRILLATDLSAVSARAHAYATGIAEDHGAQLVAVYVDYDGPAFSFERSIDLQQLSDWLHRQSAPHGDTHRTESIVRFGKPAEEIVQAAIDYQADLIVLGAKGLGALAGLSSHFVGGTVYEVAGSSFCPVLIVPKAR